MCRITLSDAVLYMSGNRAQKWHISGKMSPTWVHLYTYDLSIYLPPIFRNLRGENIEKFSGNQEENICRTRDGTC